MSEEQNDSPAFRLRPRRAAPKSYYTVRLEYSANPAAFIRERPRNSAKRKVFTQKSGSNSTKNIGDTSLLLNVVSKEEREREARRALLRRDIRESITTNTKISPFMQRIELNELEPNSVYKHNYITLRLIAVEEVEKDGSQVLCCLAHGIDKSSVEQFITIKLYNEFADARLIQRGKMISIGKFRTSELRDQSTFHIIVRYDELVETKASPTSATSPSSTSPSSAGILMPFVSITDMIEQPIEPFVEMSAAAPQSEQSNTDHENQDAKKVKFTASLIGIRGAASQSVSQSQSSSQSE